VKLKSLPTKILFVLLIFILTNPTSTAQLKVSIGGSLGGGSLQGNSPSVGAATTSLFIETNTVLFAEVYPRLGVVFVKDFNAIVPNVEKPYFPYLQGVTFKGITTQYFEGGYFLEEGVGLLVLNDRTFSDTNDWNYGVVISLNGGFDLRGFYLNGFKLGAGAEYGLTFTNGLPQYSSLHFYVSYTF
jgi:hypothetical protein